MKATLPLYDPSIVLQIRFHEHFRREHLKLQRVRSRSHRLCDIHYLIRTMQVDGNESIEPIEIVCQMPIK